MIKQKKSKKLFMGIFIALSFAIFAEIVLEFQTQSTVFMLDNEIQFAGRLDQSDTSNRFVASAEYTIPERLYVPFNNLNATYLNSEWEVLSFTSSDNVVYYDHVVDDDNIVLIDTEMVGISEVQLKFKKFDEVFTFDDSQLDDVFTFFVSKFNTETGEVEFFRLVDDGVEIIKAKKTNRKKYSIEEQVKSQTSPLSRLVSPKQTGIRVYQDYSLVLEKAIGPINKKDPTKSHRIYIGETQVKGNVEIVGGIGGRSLSFLEVYLFGGKVGADLSIEINFAEIRDGGQFDAYDSVNNENISGIVTNHGETGFKVRIATGQLMGSVFNFVTMDELDNINRNREEEVEKRQERAEIQRELEAEKEDSGIDPDLDEDQLKEIEDLKIKTQEQHAKERAGFALSNKILEGMNSSLYPLEHEIDTNLATEKINRSPAQQGLFEF